MTRATPLPPELTRRPFTVAEATSRGVPPDVLDGARFRRPHRGVRVPADLADSLPVRCAALQLVLPATAAFSGRTALALHGIPAARLERTVPEDLCVSVPDGRVPRVSGVRVQQSRWAASWRLLPADGLPGVSLRVVLPVHVWCDLVPELPLPEGVALGDAVRRRWADQQAMTDAVAARARSRGATRLRQVLSLVRYPVDSRMESLTRVLLHDAGLPAPEVNRDVVELGGWIGRPDLSWPAVKVAVEYDGDHHRTDRRQWRKDVGRRRLMQQHGWLLIVLTAEDVLGQPHRVVVDVGQALRERGLTW